MATLGNALGYELPEYKGLLNAVMQDTVPLNYILNLEFENVNGDTITWDYFVKPTIDFKTADDFPNGNGDCSTIDTECLGANKITHTLKKNHRKMYILDNCRVSNMANLSSQATTSIVNVAVAGIENAYAEAFGEYAINLLVDGWATIIAFVPAASAINVEDQIEESVTALENLHNRSRTEQTVIVSFTTNSELNKLNYACCELTSRFEPTTQNKIGVERMVKVPDSFLYDVTGDVQYQFVNYTKQLYTYSHKCDIARVEELTNERADQVGYLKKQIWGLFLDETVTQIPEVNGVAGHKVAEIVAP